jgi:hypothetical protein
MVVVRYLTSEGMEQSEMNFEETEHREIGYLRSPASHLITLICKNDVDVKANEALLLEVKEVEIPDNHIITVLDRYRHSFGFILAVGEEGKPAKIEQVKKITHVVFYPILNGRINTGELVGVVVATMIKKGRKEVIAEKLREVDKAISIDPDVFVKSDWPYLWR